MQLPRVGCGTDANVVRALTRPSRPTIATAFKTHGLDPGFCSVTANKRLGDALGGERGVGCGLGAAGLELAAELGAVGGLGSDDGAELGVAATAPTGEGGRPPWGRPAATSIQSRTV